MYASILKIHGVYGNKQIFYWEEVLCATIQNGDFVRLLHTP